MHAKKLVIVSAAVVAVAIGSGSGCGEQQGGGADAGGGVVADAGPDSGSGAQDAGVDAGQPPAPLTIEVQSSSPDYAVNAELIEGETEVVLVDALFFKPDAQALVQKLQATGKKLTTVFLTHAHPDHYSGLAIVKDAFPDAKIVTTSKVLADFQAKAPGTFQYLKGVIGDGLADRLETPQALQGALTVDGRTLEVIDVPVPGESAAAAAIGVASPHVLIGGDVLYGKAHLVLAECGADGWLQNLGYVRALGYEKFYPGHGASADVKIVDEDAAYITAVRPILDGAPDVMTAKQQIAQKYPDYAAPALLDFSVTDYFQNCRK